MFGSLFGAQSGRMATKMVQNIFSRSLQHTPAPPRAVKFNYDKEIVEKYPRVLDVIQQKLAVEKLNAVEKAAHFTATYRSRVGGAQTFRRRVRQREFQHRVDMIVKRWNDESFAQTKKANRVADIRRAQVRDWKLYNSGNYPHISTYQKVINRTPTPPEGGYVLTKTDITPFPTIAPSAAATAKKSKK